MKHMITRKKYAELVEIAEAGGASLAGNFIDTFLETLEVEVEEEKVGWWQRFLSGR